MKSWLNTKHHYKRGVYYTYKHHVHMYMKIYVPSMLAIGVEMA